MEFRILGPLEVVEGTTAVRIASGHERRLLLLLLLRAPHPVSLSAIIDALWPDDPPPSAQKVVQNYVLRLRKAVGANRIRTVADGYALIVEFDSVDAWVAADGLRRAKDALAAGDAAASSGLTAAAVGLWRGQALADVRDDLFAQPEIARLDELRLTGIEDGFEAALAVGRHQELIPELRQHVAAHPLRERPRAQLMLALYRSGGQADALAEYRSARSALADQGLEPGRGLRDLEQAMLNHAAELELTPPARVVGAPPATAKAASPRGRRSWRRAAVVFAALALAALVAAVLVDRDHYRPISSLRSDTLAELDPATGRVERSFMVGDTPTAVAVSPGAVWTTSFGNRTVTRVDLRTGRPSVIGGPPSTPTSIAAGADAVWVASAFDGTVERLDSGTGSPLAVLHLLPGVTEILVAAARVWAINEPRGSLTAIDVGSNRISTTTTGLDRPAGVAFGAGRIWVTEEGTRRLDAVDPRTGRILSRVPLQLRPGAAAFGAGAVWIVDPSDGAVTRVDVFTGRQQVISVGQVPARIAVSGGRVWVTLDRDHALVLIDGSTGSVLKRLSLAPPSNVPMGTGVTPGGLAASPAAVWLAVQAI